MLWKKKIRMMMMVKLIFCVSIHNERGARKGENVKRIQKMEMLVAHRINDMKDFKKKKRVQMNKRKLENENF